MTAYEDKLQKLEKMTDAYTDADCVLAFSGGVDSSLLLEMLCEKAKKKRTNVYAVTAHTKLHPMEDLEVARQVAREAGAIHQVVGMDELKEAGIEDNPTDRCYLCKKCIFTKIRDFAEEKQVFTLIEGTNADDLKEYRPGLRALKELGIESPLAACEMTKAEVRKLAAEKGIRTANRPSTPCMATRFPYGDRLTWDMLQAVEAGEAYLRTEGYYNVRLRVHGDIARIEVDSQDMDKVLEHKAEIAERIKAFGFNYVTLDLEGFRSGSMDVGIAADRNRR